jgi:eukaryotic-like serine/threonine-protein kinase
MKRAEPPAVPDQPSAADPPASDPAERVRHLIRQGQSLDARVLLSSQPQLKADKSLVLDLAYEEYCQHCEAGQAVDAEEFCRRFPYQSSLRRLLGVHDFLQQNPHLLADNKQASWPAPGQEFLGFTLVRELGRGSFARVFLAAEPALGGRSVAVKVSRLSATEAQTLGRLDHPNIVPVHSVQHDPHTGFTVICMPYLGSATLCDVLDRAAAETGLPQSARVIWQTAAAPPGSGALPVPVNRLGRGTYVDAAVRIGCQLADALAFAHAQGVCHRDLKPSNVLLATDGRPMLLDFNLSSDQQQPHTAVGGTLPYMAPEQLQAIDPASGAGSAVVDARSDVYALGVILYELLTGTHPFAPLPALGTREDARSCLVERQRHGAPPLRRANPQVDRPLARIIERCLALSPRDRPPSAGELASTLRQNLSWRRRLCRWAGRHRRLATGAALALALVAALVVYAWATRDPYSVRQQRLGSASYRQGRYREAIEHLSRALEDDPGSAALHFARGRAFQRLGDFNLAIADYYASPKRDADGPTLASEGYCYCLQGNYKAALPLLRRAAAMGVASPELFNDLGYCHLQLDQLDDARRALDRAIGLDPNLQALYYNRALIPLKRVPVAGLDQGLADIRRAVEIGPPASDLYRHAAVLFAAAGAHDRAIGFLRQAVEQGLDLQSVRDDFAFRDLRADPGFQELIRTPHARTTATRSVRILDPIKD